jgi:predicted RNase H-like HicB family nuclease
LKTYRVKVQQGESGWLVAQVVGLPEAISQGKDLSELAYMIRDAITTLTDKTRFELQLIVPPTVEISAKPASRRRRKAA